MKPFVFVFVMVGCLLAVCGQSVPVSAVIPEEKPLFTDANIDTAQLQMPVDMKELVGIDEDAMPTGGAVSTLSDGRAGELTSQTVLSNTSGFVYYIQLDQSPIIGAVPYSLYRHNQRTDVRELIYAGQRFIQSVAGNADGNMVVVSMKETTDIASDLDIYLFNLSDLANPAIFLLSFDSVDNANVAMSADASRIVNEEPVSGKASVVLRTKQPFAGYNHVILNQTKPQRQPSISGTGQFITLVRELADGRDRVLRYTIASNSYLGVATHTAVLEYPSISNDGQKVLWLRHGRTDIARLKNLATGTTQIVADGPFLGHPYLTGDGLFMTYQSRGNIVTKNLASTQEQTIATSFTRLIGFYGPMWQMFPETLETQKIPRLLPFGEFGYAVGMDGDLIVVGEPKANGSAGAAYILQRSAAGIWSIVKTLLASDGAAGDHFGYAVSISGDTVVVGAPFDDRATTVGGTELPEVGSAYIFQKDWGGLNQWGQVKKLIPSGQTFARASFGESVDIAGDTVVVGAPGDTGRAAYIFMRHAGAAHFWGQTKKILPGDFANGFGTSVSVSFDTVVVGAPYDAGNAEPGAAYIFLRNQGGAGNWGQGKKLIPSDVIRFGQFGYSVAVSGNTVVVGARYQDIDINRNGVLECDDISSDECLVGAAYVFERHQGGTEAWGQVKKLFTSDMAGADTFGYAVAIWGDALVVGAPNKPDFNSVGAAYVFGRFQGGGNGWGQVKKLEASDSIDGFYVGFAVAISGSRVVVGGPRFTNNDGVGGEAVYIYE